MTQHTPGPWINDQGSIQKHFAGHAIGLAIVTNASSELAPEAQANARLIAAAPDLLAAAEAGIDALDAASKAQRDSARAMLRTAIDRARGEE